MRPDPYTKVVLTIIAACLLIQGVQSLKFGQLRVTAQESNRSEEAKFELFTLFLPDQSDCNQI